LNGQNREGTDFVPLFYSVRFQLVNRCS
jgi:hypothetical protein